MAIRRLKAKVKEASSVALNAITGCGGATKANRVLVVYGGDAARIYYEGDGAPVAVPVPSKSK